MICIEVGQNGLRHSPRCLMLGMGACLGGPERGALKEGTVDHTNWWKSPSLSKIG